MIDTERAITIRKGLLLQIWKRLDSPEELHNTDIVRRFKAILLARLFNELMKREYCHYLIFSAKEIEVILILCEMLNINNASVNTDKI